MNKIRRFGGNDWQAFAGAEKFSNGAEPLIYENTMGSIEITMVADKRGIEIYFFDGEENISWRNDKELSSLQAEGAMRAIAEAFDSYVYAPDLAYALDNESRSEFQGFEFYGLV